MKEDEDIDVLVIGAGPAGTSAAALLAEKGWRVTILEKEPLPRYKVGESLIPFCWFPLDRLGVVDRLDASGFIVHKHSVQFVSPAGKRSKPFYFFEHSDHPSARTWQVVRSEFDQLLLDNAVERGARLRKQTTAEKLLHEDGRIVGVRARGAEGTRASLRARVTIDASGRDAFAQTSKRWKIPDERLRKVAVWTYYEGAVRDPGVDEGATTIAYLPDKGWFWYLPLSNDVVSVGAVAERDYLFGGTRDPDEIFAREVDVQPWIRDHLEPGRKIQPCRVTTDFTYRSRHCAADGLILVGDAFSFIDPVFSSGVFLALHTGVHAADAVHAALEANDVSASRFIEYGERMCAAMEAMRRLVHAFYDPSFTFSEFLKAHPELRDAVTDCLVGDLHADFGPLFDAMGDYAAIPPTLPYGAPLQPGSSD